MKTHPSANRESGFSRVELLAVIFVIGVLALMFVASVNRNGERRAPRLQCANNLKQCALSFRVWQGDHGDKYPMNLSETNGGTAEFTSGPNLWRHFQVMSNELSTPKVVICPADSRLAATNFAFLRNSNVSFFIGLSATETDPQSLLAGDRNLTNGTPVRNGILELTTNHIARWTSELHNRCGNIALSDGSVQQMTDAGLQTGLSRALVTNRLQMPILGP